MAGATVTTQMHNPDTGKKFSVVTSSTTSANDAMSIMSFKVALIRAVVDSATVTQDIVSAGGSLPSANGAGVGADAILVLRKTISGTKKTVIQKINEMSSVYRLGQSEGDVDVSASDITDFAGAYRDGAGNAGWEAVSGYFKD